MVENLIRLGSSMKYYNLASKKSDLSKVRSSLEEKKKIVLQCVKSLKKTTVLFIRIRGKPDVTEPTVVMFSVDNTYKTNVDQKTFLELLAKSNT